MLFCGGNLNCSNSFFPGGLGWLRMDNMSHTQANLGRCGVSHKLHAELHTWLKTTKNTTSRNGKTFGACVDTIQCRFWTDVTGFALYQYLSQTSTPNIAFRHLPSNSARFSYTTEGALSISAQLFTDVGSALWKVWVLIRLWKQPSAQART